MSGELGPLQSCNLRDAVLCFHKVVNLISFDLAEVFVIRLETSTYRSGRGNVKYRQTSSRRTSTLQLALESAN